MTEEDMLSKEEVEIGSRKFLISTIPAIQAQEIYGKVVKSVEGVGDIGMTYLPEETARKLLSYTAVREGSAWLMLDDDLNYKAAFPDLLTLIKLEAAMIRKNFGFLLDGKLLEVLDYLRSAKNQPQDT